MITLQKKYRMLLAAVLACVGMAAVLIFVFIRGGSGDAGSDEMSRLPRADPQKISELNTQFRDEFSAQDGLDGGGDLERMRMLLTERREEMKLLLLSDPQEALRLALTDEERADLPKELLPLIEEPVRTSGDFMVAIACSGYHEPGAHPESEYWREALIPGGKGPIRVHTYGPRQEVNSLENAPLDGIRIEDVAALYGTPLRLLRPGDEGFVAGEIHARFGGSILTFPTPEAFDEAQALAIEAERNAEGPAVSYPELVLSQAATVMDSSLVMGERILHNNPSPQNHE